MKQYGYHAGPLDKDYKSENLSIGDHSTQVCSGTFYCLSPEEVEYHGAGFNGEHKQDIHKIDLSGLHLFKTTYEDLMSLRRYNNAMRHFPVWIEYNSGAYEDVDRALESCYDIYYCDEVPDDEKAEKFVRELYDDYKIQADDVAEIDGEHYSFQDYVNDVRQLKHLRAVLRDLPETLHNTLPAWQNLLNGDRLLEVREKDTKYLKGKDFVYVARFLRTIFGGGTMYTPENVHNIFVEKERSQYPSSDSYVVTFVPLDEETGEELHFVERFECEVDKPEAVDEWSGVTWNVGKKRSTLKCRWPENDNLKLKVVSYDKNWDLPPFAYKDRNSGAYEELRESTASFSKQDLIDQLDNYIDKRETAKFVEKALVEVAQTLDYDYDDIVDWSMPIYNKYEDLYDVNTGRFDNFKAPPDDNFATQLMLQMGYDGTYPVGARADSTEFGGCIFHFDKSMIAY